MRFKIVVRHEIDSFGEIVGVEYCVVSVNADGFERRENGGQRGPLSNPLLPAPAKTGTPKNRQTLPALFQSTLVDTRVF